jgi:hypothetical protein
MAYPKAGIIAAKYLLDSFVIPNMKNSNAFIDDFRLFSSTVTATVATAHRAMEQLSTKVKIGYRASIRPWRCFGKQNLLERERQKRYAATALPQKTATKTTCRRGGGDGVSSILREFYRGTFSDC